MGRLSSPSLSGSDFDPNGGGGDGNGLGERLGRVRGVCGRGSGINGLRGERGGHDGVPCLSRQYFVVARGGEGERGGQTRRRRGGAARVAKSARTRRRRRRRRVHRHVVDSAYIRARSLLRQMRTEGSASGRNGAVLAKHHPRRITTREHVAPTRRPTTEGCRLRSREAIIAMRLLLKKMKRGNATRSRRRGLLRSPAGRPRYASLVELRHPRYGCTRSIRPETTRKSRRRHQKQVIPTNDSSNKPRASQKSRAQEWRGRGELAALEAEAARTRFQGHTERMQKRERRAHTYERFSNQENCSQTNLTAFARGAIQQKTHTLQKRSHSPHELCTRAPKSAE